ncbi:MAG: hypothetical protein HY064_03115 [Bacteroidetes bacterium]|nr:hypothetical protein [Bacteroidota bacterium]
MKKYFSVALVLLLFFFASCGNSAADKAASDSTKKMAFRDSLLKNIRTAEYVFKPHHDASQREVTNVLNAYAAFTNKFPQDTATAEFLMRASFREMNMMNYKQAAEFLETIIDRHKDYKRYSDACFTAANIYSTYLLTVEHGDDRAKQLYKYVIDNYPNTSNAKQAAVLITYVGMSNEQMFDAIQRKADSTDKANAKMKK